MIDHALPFDARVEKKEEEKCTNYSELKYEITKICKMRKVVLGALGTVTKDFEKWLEKLDLDLKIEALKKACLLGTAKVIQKVLDMK